tara:strand:- start:795 stop:1988 length:1194 start_codon:yes stop_codon:yes gene_type:complete
MFVDTIQIDLLSGSGGSGSVSFSSKNSKTSPNGANGGNGGSIFLITDSNVFDYSNLKSKGSFKAENGGDASKNLQNGANGKDIYLKIPIGTSVISNGELLAEIIDENVEYKICQGGLGGRGNKDLMSKRNPNPEICESGEKRRKITLNLELSLMTDVALIGLPNAGKSSLITTITNSNSKVDSYPFTTVSPSLGVYENNSEIITICDLPGLIEGAAKGTGLGKSVLRHLKNTKFIIFLLDPDNSEYNIEEQINLLENEIQTFNPEFKNIKNIKVVNKSDLDKTDNKYINISTVTKEGINELLKQLDDISFTELNRVNKSYEKIFIETDEFDIHADKDIWTIRGRRAEKITNLKGNSHEILNEISYRFEKSSISHELINQGIKKGDIVDLNGHEFSYE